VEVSHQVENKGGSGNCNKHFRNKHNWLLWQCALCTNKRQQYKFGNWPALGTYSGMYASMHKIATFVDQKTFSWFYMDIASLLFSFLCRGQALEIVVFHVKDFRTENVYFSWNRFPIKKIYWLIWLRQLCETDYLDINMCKSESSQSFENRAQSADSSKACSKPIAFNGCISLCSLLTSYPIIAKLRLEFILPTTV